MPTLANGGTIEIPFKKENIVVTHTAEAGMKTTFAAVPDLICVLDTGSGPSLGVAEFKYGCKVTFLGIACSPR